MPTKKKFKEFDLKSGQSFHNNPRKFATDEDRKKFEGGLEALGDIGGVLMNTGRQTGRKNEFIGGNQRMTAMLQQIGSDNFHELNIVIDEEYEIPTPAGTLAVGRILMPHTGEWFAFRVVDWNDDQCDLANLRANRSGAKWDFEKLDDFNEDLLKNEFDDDFFKKLLKLEVAEAQKNDPNYNPDAEYSINLDADEEKTEIKTEGEVDIEQNKLDPQLKKKIHRNSERDPTDVDKDPEGVYGMKINKTKNIKMMQLYFSFTDHTALSEMLKRLKKLSDRDAADLVLLAVAYLYQEKTGQPIPDLTIPTTFNLPENPPENEEEQSVE
ncbi:MAG: hypothetical protein AAFO96_03690 [Bacteroidota bacterium]